MKEEWSLKNDENLSTDTSIEQAPLKNCILTNIKSQPKWKYGLIWFLLLLVGIWIFCYTQVKRIETLATFPAVAINVQDLVGHVETDLEFEEINIKDSKWNNINGLYLENSKEEAKTVYYFHGNGWPLSYFYSEIQYIHSLGYNVMAYDYPGYGKSTGFPYKENVDEFSKLFYEHIQSEKGINEENLILWGYSVGTAVVSDFASKNNFEKLILVSPLASRYDMSEKLFWIPLQLYLGQSNSYVTKELVKDFKQDVLIVHGNTDKIVPYNQWKLVYKNYWLHTKANKSFIEIDNYGHNGIIDNYGQALEMKIRSFLINGKLEQQINILNSQNKKKWERESHLYNTIYTLDLESDSSLTKFVNDKVSFNVKSYVPDMLVGFASSYVTDGKWGYSKVRKEIIQPMNKLWKAFYEKFGKKLIVNSAYRSYAYQKWIKNRGCPDHLCAKAGYSEHQSGLAIDIFDISTQAQWKANPTLWKYFEWLKVEAPKYGFTNTYQKGRAIDWYAIEPWHWRYIGKDLAMYLAEKDLTFAEYYNQQKKESN